MSAVNIIRQDSNIFVIDLSQADVQPVPPSSVAKIAGDTYQVNLPGSSTVTVANGSISSTTGSSVLTVTLANTAASGVTKGQQLNLDVILTRSAVTYAFEFRSVLNVFDISNP